MVYKTNEERADVIHEYLLGQSDPDPVYEIDAGTQEFAEWATSGDIPCFRLHPEKNGLALLVDDLNSR